MPLNVSMCNNVSVITESQTFETSQCQYADINRTTYKQHVTVGIVMNVEECDILNKSPNVSLEYPKQIEWRQLQKVNRRSKYNFYIIQRNIGELLSLSPKDALSHFSYYL